MRDAGGRKKRSAEKGGGGDLHPERGFRRFSAMGTGPQRKALKITFISRTGKGRAVRQKGWIYGKKEEERRGKKAAHTDVCTERAVEARVPGTVG